MQFTEKDIESVRTAIAGLGQTNVFALAMALSDGVIRVEILKHTEEGLQNVVLSGHPFYTQDWNEVNAFLDAAFSTCPGNVVRVSDYAGFNKSNLLASL